jgi:peptidoglycan hydrolase CwlO-like protein
MAKKTLIRPDAKVENKLDRLEGKLDRVMAQIRNLETKLDRQNRSIIGLESKLDRLEAKIDRKLPGKGYAQKSAKARR